MLNLKKNGGRMNSVDNKFNLHIPEHRKVELFQLIKERSLEKVNEPNRKVFERVMEETRTLWGFADPFDAYKEWESCVKLAESELPKTIFKFWEALVKSGEKKFKFNTNGGESPKKDREISLLVYTALAENLLTNINCEPDLFNCVEKFNKIIEKPSEIDWKKIDTSNFLSRLRENWSAWLHFFPNSGEKSSEAFRSIGFMSINDFAKPFFSENLCSHNYVANDSIILNRNITLLIASFLPNLNNFRKTCKTSYNVVEENTVLRICHRMNLINYRPILKQLLGVTLFFNNNYHLTTLDELCRITSVKNPDQSAICYVCNTGEKVIGGHVIEYGNGCLKIFIVVASDFFDNYSYLNYLKVSSFEELATGCLNLKKICLHHNEHVIGYDLVKSIFTVSENKVIINAEFWKNSFGIDLHFHKYYDYKIGDSKNQQIEFHFSDFDSYEESN